MKQRRKNMDKLKAAAESAGLLKALGNSKRLEIVFILREGERKVGELEKIIGISQSALSQHLAVLRTAGIVSTRRDAQSVFYSLSDKRCRRLLDLLEKLAD